MYALTLLLFAATPALTTNDNDQGGSSGEVRSSSAGGWGYHAGSLQIFLDAPPFTAQYTINAPVPLKGFAYRSDGRGGSTFDFGLSGGVGYCVTDVLEFGGAIAFNFSSISGAGGGSATAFDFALEPFAKFNLASVFGTGGINPFATVGPVIGIGQYYGEGSTGVIGLDMNVGVEFFIEKHWGISAYVPINVIDNAGYTSNVNFIVGLGFGLFGYLGSEPIHITIN
jgi:hypothetical protein